MSKKKNLWLHLCLFAVGGLGYVLIELLWRGRSHPSMFLVGGICFEMIGGVDARCRRRPLLVRCALCALGITAVELVSGCILNRWLGLGVWDYSRMRYNILGQVCLLYSLFWLLLSAAAFPLYRRCRRLLTGALVRRGGAERR